MEMIFHMRLIKISQSLIVASGEKKNFLEFEGGLQVEVSDVEYRKSLEKFTRPKINVLLEDEGVQQL